MKMQRLPDVEIVAGSVTEFKPGEKHIMLIGLSAPLSAGSEFPLKLEFENAGQKEIIVKVFKDGEQPMGHMKHSQ
jgi:copper(I)-binding protein